ncbi:MAG: response regulator [Polyangiaceae bacterium]|nr:response regulator [Polyangiaceae bacterium]
MSAGAPRRIIVIDDNPAIVNDFRKLLCPEPPGGAPASKHLDELDAAIFGGTRSEAPRDGFLVDSASQGQEGYERIKRMRYSGRPYALAFVDMRMPPGWDGIETLERIWADSPDLEAVICSAYSDYSWNEVIKRLNRPALRLLSKPFESKDVLDLAWTLTTRWLRKQAPTPLTSRWPSGG